MFNQTITVYRGLTPARFKPVTQLGLAQEGNHVGERPSAMSLTYAMLPSMTAEV